MVKNYKIAFFMFTVLFLVVTKSFWLNGEVLSHTRQHHELMISDAPTSLYIENNKFSDFNRVYLPEIKQYVTALRSSSIALWTSQNELGRPLHQLSGFGPSYFPFYFMMQLSDNPWVLITAFSLATCFFTGGFVMLFCRELKLVPLAGLFAGITLAFSPIFMYWLTFPMFLSTYCWAIGILFSIQYALRRTNLLVWLLLAFCTYSLFISSYPQSTIHQLYLIVGYSLYLVYVNFNILGHKKIFQLVVFVSSAIIVGVFLVLPVYLDLISMATDSARLKILDMSLFSKVLPKFESMKDVGQFLVLSTVPELFGNPISPEFGFRYNGVSFTSMVCFFSIVGLIISFKKVWGWWFAVVISFLLGTVPPIYLFAVKYLGFNLSGATPLGIMVLPLIMISTYGVHTFITNSSILRSRAIFLAGILYFLILGLGVFLGIIYGISISFRILLLYILIVGSLVAQHRKPNFILLLFAMIISTVLPLSLMLKQPLKSIETTSSFVELVNKNLEHEMRYANVSGEFSALSPNFNALLDLPSIHTYNSLSSKYYHKAVADLGGSTTEFGRWNSVIHPDFDSLVFWMSNIGLILADKKIEHQNLDFLEQYANVYFYKVKSTMGSYLQTPYLASVENDSVEIDPRFSQNYQLEKRIDKGDYLEFKTAKQPQSILVLSQKYHKNWIAQILTSRGWVKTKTLIVNGIFQGVLLPDNTEGVRLWFKPYARYMAVSHLFWVIALLILMVKIGFSKRRNDRLS